MSRSAAILVAGLALLAPGAPAGGDGAQAEAVRITADEPAARLGIGAPSGEVLGLRLSEIVNPAMVPFGVVVSLPDGDEIGRFAVYPPDRSGDYMLSLEPHQRARLAAAGELEARLDLSAPAPGLVVEIAVAPAPARPRP